MYLCRVRTVYTERARHSQDSSDVTIEMTTPNSVSLRVQDHVYLNTIVDPEETRTTEEPYYHEIADSGVNRTRPRTAEHSSRPNAPKKTVYQSVQRNGSTPPFYAQLRTNRPAFVQHCWLAVGHGRSLVLDLGG